MTEDQARAEIETLLSQIDQTPLGPEEYRLTARAVALAVEAGDEGLEYKARMRLTASASNAGDTDAMLASFAWCLAKHEADPDAFPDEVAGAADLAWQYKWMPRALDRSTAFPLEQTEAVLDDMEARYRQAGLGLSAVVAERFSHAWTTGQMDEARRLRALLDATPRDSHSDCDACSRSGRLSFAAELGQDELALKLIDEIIQNGYACAEEPESALGSSLILFLRNGRLEDAKLAHLRSYRMARRKPDSVAVVADNLVFCAITGNQAQALEMVERHLPWLVHDQLNDQGRLALLTAIGLALDSLERIGQGGQPVRRAVTPELAAAAGLGDAPARRAWTAAELGPPIRAAADALARAFDARNANAYVSAQVAATRALLDQPYDLPIQDRVLAEPPPGPAEPTDPLGWLEAAYFVARWDEPERQLEFARRILDATADQSPNPSPDQSSNQSPDAAGVAAARPPTPDQSSNQSPDAAGVAAARPPAPDQSPNQSPDAAGGPTGRPPAPVWAGSGGRLELRLMASQLVVGALAALDLADQAAAALAKRLADLRRLGRHAQAQVEELAGLAVYTPAEPALLARARDLALTLGGLEPLAARLALAEAEALRRLETAPDAAGQARRDGEPERDSEARREGEPERDSQARREGEPERDSQARREGEPERDSQARREGEPERDSQARRDGEPERDSQGRAKRVAELLEFATAIAPEGSLERSRAWAVWSNFDDDDPPLQISRIDKALGADLPAGRRADYLLGRARINARAGRLAEGLADADQAARIYAAWGCDAGGAEAATAGGLLAGDAGDFDGAIARFRHAIRLNQATGRFSATAIFQLAVALTERGQAWEAVELFSDLLEVERERGETPALMAETLEWLGRALEAEGELGAALAHCGEGAELYLASGSTAGAVRCLWRQARLLRAADRSEDAVELLGQALDLLESADWRDGAELRLMALTVLEARAFAKADLDDSSALDDVEQARQAALAGPSAWRAADLLDSKARVLGTLGRREQAVSVFLEAADAYRAAEDRRSAGRAELFAARTLAGPLRRPGEARSLLAATLASLDGAEGAGDLIDTIKSVLARLA